MDTGKIINEELMAKTFLYARKRLGNDVDAEELAGDILLSALEGLRRADERGEKIVSFYSWYWRLASNRTNMFLRLKYDGCVRLDDVPEPFVPDGTVDRLIREEEQTALWSALSVLSRSLREVMVLRYLAGMTEREISGCLGIPGGTVRRRLHDAAVFLRGELVPEPETQSEIKTKKGTRTMEKTGRSAFAPVEVMWCGRGSAPDYYSTTQDLMTKQILVICRERPHTVREISDEIAVAPVYFEEKLDFLKENRFIKETSRGKYLTDLVMLPMQAEIDMSERLADIYSGLAPEIRDAILGVLPEIRTLDFYGNDFPEGRLMWLMYVWACQSFSASAVGLFRRGKDVPASNGKKWRYEGIFTLPDEKLVFHERRSVNWSNMHTNFRDRKYSRLTFANLYQIEPFPDRSSFIGAEHVSLLTRLSEDPGAELSESEKYTAAELVGAGFLEKTGKGLKPALPVMAFETSKKIIGILGEAVSPLIPEYESKAAKAGDEIILPHIRRDLYEEYVNFIMQNAFFPYSYVMFECLKSPEDYHLEIPEDYAKSALSTAIYYSV